MGNKIWWTIHPRKILYDVTVRPSVRTFRVWVSRNEFLPSPLESVVPYCFKSLKKWSTNQNLSTDQMFGGF